MNLNDFVSYVGNRTTHRCTNLRTSQLVDAVNNSSCEYVKNNYRFKGFGLQDDLFICIFIFICSLVSKYS